jgi:hypothetical protein
MELRSHSSVSWHLVAIKCTPKPEERKVTEIYNRYNSSFLQESFKTQIHVVCKMQNFAVNAGGTAFNSLKSITAYYGRTVLLQ